MFNKNDIEKILIRSKKKRIKELEDELDNIIFLDYDGVINTDLSNFGNIFNNKSAIYYLNKLCIENNFKIVVSSSWKKYPNYKEILYNSGLDKNIIVLGKTIVSNEGREYEIKDYLKEHPYIDKFIVLDDGLLPEFKKYQIKTETTIGFDKTKYEEAISLIRNL